MPVESKMSTWFLKIKQWSRVQEAKGSLLSPLSLLAKYLKNEANKNLVRCDLSQHHKEFHLSLMRQMPEAVPQQYGSEFTSFPSCARDGQFHRDLATSVQFKPVLCCLWWSIERTMKICSLEGTKYEQHAEMGKPWALNIIMKLRNRNRLQCFK